MLMQLANVAYMYLHVLRIRVLYSQDHLFYKCISTYNTCVFTIFMYMHYMDVCHICTYTTCMFAIFMYIHFMHVRHIHVHTLYMHVHYFHEFATGNCYYGKWIYKGAISLSVIKMLNQDEDVSFTGRVLERFGFPKKPEEMDNGTIVRHTINWSIR